jgi:hypothetical protein
LHEKNHNVVPLGFISNKRFLPVLQIKIVISASAKNLFPVISLTTRLFSLKESE